VTARGVLRPVESGRIGPDEPVIGRLRRWPPPPSPFDADGVTVRRLLSHTAGLSVHGYVGQPSDRPLPPIAASLSGETGDSFPRELLEPPGRGWLYSGGGYSLRQLLVEELTGRPFADSMQAEVLGPLGMTASSFRWSWTAETARTHDADGRPIPDFAFAERAAAGLALLPDRRAAIAVLANGDDGNAPIDAVVQQWLGLATPNPKRARGRIAVLGALAVVAVVATATRWRRRRGPRGRAGVGMEPRRPAW
jgi:hypothetical protein